MRQEMSRTVEAVFDGEVLRPKEPIDIEPNTRVRITIEPLTPTGVTAAESFLRTAESLRLDGPPDWSDRIDEYLYGSDVDGRD
jgi:predicted DNA-binding antitoxin AbrB/MazE fold protein